MEFLKVISPHVTQFKPLVLREIFRLFPQIFGGAFLQGFVGNFDGNFDTFHPNPVA